MPNESGMEYGGHFDFAKPSNVQEPPRRYMYVGDDPKLKGHTALGQWSKRSNGFIVQIDDLKHAWSCSWNLAVPQHWEEIKSA